MNEASKPSRVTPASGTITAIALQERRSNRVNIHLDGRYAFSLDLDLAAGLKRGQALSKARVAELLVRDEGARAVDRVFRLLALRPRSRQEIERYLQGKEFSEVAVGAACARLQELGYVDDAAFARWWVENRLAHRPRGRIALRSELRAHGVDRATVAAVVDPIDETPAAHAVARDHGRRCRHLDRPAFDRRVGGYLQRRGFAYDTIRLVVDQVFRELNADRA